MKGLKFFRVRKSQCEGEARKWLRSMNDLGGVDVRSCAHMAIEWAARAELADAYARRAAERGTP